MTVEDARALFSKTNMFLSDVYGQKYHISDFREATSTFSDMIQILATARNAEGGTGDLMMKVIFLGTDEWVKKAIAWFKQPQYGGVDIPAFLTLEDAWQFVRQDIAKIAIS